MTEATIKELRQQNQQLRYLLLSLSVTLLGKAATESEMRRSLDRVDAERFVHEAEGCFRCARIPGIKSEIAEGLEVAGHELMAAAVAIETELQRAKKPQPGSASPLCDLLEKHAKTLIRISYGVKESEVAEAIEEVAYALRAVAREHPSAPHVDCSGSS